MLGLLLGKNPQQTASPVGKASFLDQPMLSKNIFDMCFDVAVGAVEICGKGFSKVTDSLTAAVVVPSWSDIGSSFSFGKGSILEPEVSAPSQKLGLNAQKSCAIDNSPFSCSMNDVVVPTVGGQKMAQQGFGIQQ